MTPPRDWVWKTGVLPSTSALPRVQKKTSALNRRRRNRCREDPEHRGRDRELQKTSSHELTGDGGAGEEDSRPATLPSFNFVASRLGLKCNQAVMAKIYTVKGTTRGLWDERFFPFSKFIPFFPVHVFCLCETCVRRTLAWYKPAAHCARRLWQRKISAHGWL